MHVLHLIKTSEGATWAINQIKDMKHNFPELTFSVVIPNGGKHIDEYYRVCENVYLFDFKLDLKIFSRGFLLRKIVKKEQPDIIHSWFTQTTLYARLFLRNFDIPRVFQVVGPLHLESKIFNFFDINSANANDFWIATSKYILKKYKDADISDSRLFLNYAYIDVDKIISKSREVEAIDFRARYKIPEQSKIIGTASYIYPPKFYEKVGLKGHELLLDVFSEILEKGFDVYLVIAGGTFGDNIAYEKSLYERAAAISKERIIFTGKYKEVYSVISNLDLFIYLSRSENLGGVFESLLYSIPTLSSDRGGLPELVENNVTGYTVALEDKEEIISKILEMLEMDLSLFKKNGKEKVISIFDKEKLLENAFQIYKNISK